MLELSAIFPGMYVNNNILFHSLALSQNNPLGTFNETLFFFRFSCFKITITTTEIICLVIAKVYSHLYGYLSHLKFTVDAVNNSIS